jgi:haloacetate dehalogenase
LADLRGYGDSGKPAPDTTGFVYIWQQYASDVRGDALPTGHFLAEEAPDLVRAALGDFFD